MFRLEFLWLRRKPWETPSGWALRNPTAAKMASQTDQSHLSTLNFYPRRSHLRSWSRVLPTTPAKRPEVSFLVILPWFQTGFLELNVGKHKGRKLQKRKELRRTSTEPGKQTKNSRHEPSFDSSQKTIGRQRNVVLITARPKIGCHAAWHLQSFANAGVK